jgi:aspartate-semialdehyde dehydrogenase
MDRDVPLVVPEVNPHDVANHKGIIANPNCSTIQMVVALKPLHDAARIRRVVVSTYQSVSGAGQKGMHELWSQTEAHVTGKDAPAPSKFAHPIAFNCVPHIDDFLPNGYTKEEMKMVHETRKILGDEAIGVSPTAVRVPVVTGHSESIHVQFHRPMSAEEAKRLLREAPGVVLLDEPYAPGKHPQPLHSAGKDAVFVGRVRDDLAVKGAINLWVVSDNLRKGAALNAVQIAELL